jgi:hypothetical protein
MDRHSVIQVSHLIPQIGWNLRRHSMYVKSLAVAIQAVCIISIAPLADSRECHYREGGYS